MGVAKEQRPRIQQREQNSGAEARGKEREAMKQNLTREAVQGEENITRENKRRSKSAGLAVMRIVYSRS
jgi:hypothetical protein